MELLGTSVYESLGFPCPHCGYDWSKPEPVVISLPEIKRPVLDAALVAALREDGEHELADIAQTFLVD